MSTHTDLETDHNAIAIVGMAVRLPGAPDLDSYWDLLRTGRDAIHFFTDEELTAANISPERRNQPGFVASRGYLPDADLFDANFFGISPREAALIDPQHRVMMEVAWHAMEHAGYDPNQWEGNCAVFTSAGMNTYLPFNLFTNPGLIEQVGGFQLSIYNDKDFVPTRIAYALNTKGPAIDIGTACSSSLVGTHMACQHLLSYQSDLALVGGVTIHLPQETGDVVGPGSAYSPDGFCRPFDATPSGLVDGNGAAAIVLKRLTDAIDDRDTIHAVVKGSAINNDGSDKVGYSAPSIQGQAEVILEAQALAQVFASDISYVEAHGTATPLGDPIEVAGLTQAFRETTDAKQFCGLGSVKSNIGHVDKAAGLAGLIKIVLGLKNETLPPTAHYREANPRLNIEDTPFFVVGTAEPWVRTDSKPRIAAVSSFGVGGTNAHAIIEEAPLPSRMDPHDHPALILLSAKTESALFSAAANLRGSIGEEAVRLTDIAHTLQVGRRRQEIRTAFVTSSIDDLRSQLANLAPVLNGPDSSRVAFLFSGQGTQYPGMGRDLYDSEPVFRSTIDRIDSILEDRIEPGLISLLYGPESSSGLLKQTQYSQPALFAVEYSLAELLESWGIRPSVVLGHSLGEYVAACRAGTLSLEEGARLIASRGQLMQRMDEGRMLAVTLPAEDVREMVTEAYPLLDIAVLNGANQTVVAGPTDDIAAFSQVAQTRGLLVRELETSHAFHSRMMEPALPAFGKLLGTISWKKPAIPVIANLSGQLAEGEQICSVDYWSKHLVSPVLFHDSLQSLSQLEPDAVWLEIGPGRALTNMASAIKRPVPANFPTLPPAQSSIGAQRFLLGSIGNLWEQGVDVDWNSFTCDKQLHRVPLPGYPFQRSRFWTEPGQELPASESAEGTTGFYQMDWSLKPRKPVPEEGAKRVALFTNDSTSSIETLSQLYRGKGHTVTTRPPITDLPDLILFLLGAPPQLEDSWKNLHALATLARQIIEMGPDYQPRLVVAGPTVLEPNYQHPFSAVAALAGIVRTLNHEQNSTTSFVVDFDPGSAQLNPHDALTALVDETLRSENDGDILFRGGTRWGREFVRAGKGAQSHGLLGKVDHLILLGGDSPIGLVIAGALIRGGATSLTLTRTLHSPDCASEHADLLESWRQNGVELRLTSENQEDAFTLPELNSHAPDDSGLPLGSVGVIDATDFHREPPRNLLRDLDLCTCQEYWDEHLAHLVGLQAQINRPEVAFVMLMSSLSGHLGAASQTAHAVQSLLSEAFVQQQQHSCEVPWFISYWDQWSMTNQEMLTPEKGADAALMLFSHPAPNSFLIASNDPATRLIAVSTSDADTEISNPDGILSHARPALTTDYVPPEDPLQKSMAMTWQGFLGIDQIGIDDDFFALGGNSLLGAQLLSEINQTYSIRLEITDLFEHATIRHLAAKAFDLQAAQFSAGELADELDHLESLSDSEIQKLLDGE